MKPKPTVGQTIYSLNIGNAARNTPQVLTPMVVTKVGRKYFTLVCQGKYPGHEVNFHIDTWCQVTEYRHRHSLYLTEQEWEEERELRRLRDGIREYVNQITSAPPDRIRRISAIINEP